MLRDLFKRIFAPSFFLCIVLCFCGTSKGEIIPGLKLISIKKNERYPSKLSQTLINKEFLFPDTNSTHFSHLLLSSFGDSIFTHNYSFFSGDRVRVLSAKKTGENRYGRIFYYISFQEKKTKSILKTKLSLWSLYNLLIPIEDIEKAEKK